MWKSFHLACIQWNRMSLGMVLPASYPFYPMHTRFRHNGFHRGNTLNSARSRGAPQGTSRSLQDGGGGGEQTVHVERRQLGRGYTHGMSSRVTKAGHIGAARLPPGRMLRLHKLRIKGGRIVSAQRSLCTVIPRAKRSNVFWCMTICCM